MTMQPSAYGCIVPASHLQISPKDSFEVAFNAACGLIEGGKLGEAEEQLQLAVRVGESEVLSRNSAAACAEARVRI